MVCGGVYFSVFENAIWKGTFGFMSGKVCKLILEFGNSCQVLYILAMLQIVAYFNVI